MWTSPKTSVTTIQMTGSVSNRRRITKASIDLEYSVVCRSHSKGLIRVRRLNRVVEEQGQQIEELKQTPGANGVRGRSSGMDRATMNKPAMRTLIVDNYDSFT